MRPWTARGCALSAADRLITQTSSRKPRRCALRQSLAQNHPFIDGNERTAFAAMYTFLAMNGPRLTADAGEIYGFISTLYDGRNFNVNRLATWLRQQCIPQPT
jgi:death on curing protein